MICNDRTFTKFPNEVDSSFFKMMFVLQFAKFRKNSSVAKRGATFFIALEILQTMKIISCRSGILCKEAFNAWA
jgi:hypothetical protein